MPATHPLNVRATEAAERILKETNGQVQINVFPNNQLGNDSDMLSQLRAGGLDFFTISGVNVLSQLVPISSMWGVGFAWPNDDAVHKALDGDLGKFLRAQFPKVGLLAMDTIWSSGFRQVDQQHPPDQHARRPEGPEDARAGEPAVDLAVQAPRRVAGLDQLRRDLLVAADQGRRRPGEPARDHLDRQAVRGAEVLLDDQPHVGRLVVHDQPEGLGQDPRGGAADHREEPQPGRARMRADGAKLNASLRGELAAKGLVFNDPQLEPFRATLVKSGFYTEWKQKYGDEAWALLEKYTGKLG